MRRICFLILLTVAGCTTNPVRNGPPWRVPKSDFGGAKPLNLSGWYSAQDYPLTAIRAGEQGYVTVEFTIGDNGRPIRCRVVRSSGYPDLDAVPCRALMERAIFKPATDSNGHARETVASTSMSFWTKN